MTNCFLCKKPLNDEADYNVDRHIVCYLEWHDRVENRICIACGDKPTKDEDSFGCNTCGPNSPYLMYNGPF